jgi:hypothetical protein
MSIPNSARQFRPCKIRIFSPNCFPASHTISRSGMHFFGTTLAGITPSRPSRQAPARPARLSVRRSLTPMAFGELTKCGCFSRPFLVRFTANCRPTHEAALFCLSSIETGRKGRRHTQQTNRYQDRESHGTQGIRYEIQFSRLKSTSSASAIAPPQPPKIASRSSGSPESFIRIL